jgi:hypothetical protein
MKRIRIDPMEYPLKKGELWWIVHPNVATAEFRVPHGGITLCTKDFLTFRQNVVYSVVGADNHNGWVTVVEDGNLYDMPQYLFARYFDAEAFVVGIMDQVEFEKAKPFNYRSTIPGKPKEMEVFTDGPVKQSTTTLGDDS